MPYTFKHGDRPLDDYTIQRAVGGGGFGEVYYAVSDGGREVALKYLKDNPQIELRGTSHCINLKSPHLVSIFDVKKNGDGDYFVIMEYCSGPSLRDLLIAEPTGFAPEKAAFFVREIGKGLAYLHDRGIVHRDLKPGNLFYDDGYVKIGDYGLSKFISVSRHSAQTASIGTVHYMAPEIGSGDYSKGVDIYALGVMLYEMLLGKLPFDGSTMAEVLMKHLTAQPELSELPQPFGKVIKKAMQKDPADRFQSVDEMVEALIAVDTVKQSLAGFSTKSLEGAVRVGDAAHAPSPVPSPNPPPPPHRPNKARVDYDLRADALPKSVSKRMNRISRKMDKRLDKLSGKRRKKRQGGTKQKEKRHAFEGSRLKLFGLTCLLAAGLSLGLGFLVANAENSYNGAHSDEVGVVAGLQVLFMSASILLAHGCIGWFRVANGPNWAQHMIRLVTSAPLLAIATFPMIEYSGRALPVWLGLMFVATFAKWERDLEQINEGEISFWTAIWTGFGGLITCVIAGEICGASTDDLMFPVAGTVAAVSLIMQASSWWLPMRRGGSPPDSSEKSDNETEDYVADAVNEAVASVESVVDDLGSSLPPFAMAVGTAKTDSQRTRRSPLERWGFVRAIWGLLSFAAFGGMLVLILLAALSDDVSRLDKTGMIIGSIACGTFMLFTIRKTGPTKRVSFWQESMRPFIATAAMFGVGACTTALIRHGHQGSDELAMLITGCVLCGIIMVATGISAMRTKVSKGSSPGFIIDEPPPPPPVAQAAGEEINKV